ncbi:DUF1302 family protein [Candidatus Thioglobus sp.]|uniref:DUF1302 family protein n=1 Tax=Candidatus Thioglobus sp. TaxID=2026721 RepID=UPI003D11C571
MARCWLGYIALVLSLFAGAEDGFDEGFDDETLDIVVNHAPVSKSSLYGSVDFEMHYNVSNDKKLSSLKVLVDILGEYKLENGAKLSGNLKGYHDFVYGLKNRTAPSGYETEIDLNELNIGLEILPNLDLKIGRQVIVWGKSDSIRITDILNPLDNRTPGLIDIKNLRLGKTMSKLDYYVNDLNISVIAIHENRFTKNPTHGSDFKLATDIPINTPSDNLSNTSLALSLTGAFTGYDFGFYFADTYIDKPYVKNNTLHYDNKSKMLGFAYNQVVDNFLLKTEIAHFDNINYNNVSDNKSRTDILLGVEYNGVRDGSIGYEIALRKIHDYESAIKVALNGFKPKNEYQQALRYNQSYLNQTLDFSAVLSVFGITGQDGGLARFELDYAFDDQISMGAGVIDYFSGDNPAIDSYKDNDRIFAKLSYAF